MPNYKEKRAKYSQNTQTLAQHSPAVVGAFSTMNRKARQEGVLSEAFKELIGLGIAISARCEPCIISHINKAINLGASFEEIVEAINIAVVMNGGPGVAYGGIAIDILEEFWGDATEK